MNTHRLFLNAVAAALCFISNPAISSAISLNPGLYQISGTHSHLGPYNGYLLVKDSSEVQRAISLQPLDSAQKKKIGLHEDQIFSIEQLWEGNNTPKGALFQIRASNVLTTYNDFTATSDDLSIETIVLGRADTSFHVKNDGTYVEHYTLISKNDPAQKTPDLFPKDSRTRLDASGTSGSILINLAGWIGINRAIREYRKLPQFDPYREREEFKNNSVFHIRDFTDLEFYRDQSSILRIRNKSLTPLSIAEALQRRAAFQPTLAEKAEFKKQQTLSVMNEFGIFEVGTADSNGRIVALQPQGDTALWFGVYIWALSLEHDVTQSTDSYQRLRNAIEGMNHLVEISPDPKLFARYIHKSPANETVSDPNVRQGTGRYRDYKYDSRTNNDMVKGLLLSYVIAHKALKMEDRELKEKVSELVRRIQQLDPIRSKGSNRAIAKGLDALWNSDTQSLADFIAGSDSLTEKLSEKLYIDSGFHIGGITNPSGIHLNLISQSTRYYLAEALIKKVKTDGQRMWPPIPNAEPPGVHYDDPTSRLQAIKRSAARNIQNLSARMQKAHFSYLDIASFAVTKDPTLKPRAVDGVWGLVEVPLVRSVGHLRGNLLLQPDWMYSPWPFEPWKAIKGPWMINREKLKTKNQQRGIFGYPAFECAAMGSTYLWVSDANDFPCGGDSSSISFSADYLWAYWLARSAGVINERD